MRQVDTLWPAEMAGSPDTAAGPDGLPSWAADAGNGPVPTAWKARYAAFIVGLAGFAVAVVWLLPPGRAAVVLAVSLIGLAVAFLAFHRSRVIMIQRALDESSRWNDTLFHRPGVALWREDWSVARDAVLRLLKSGVTDMQAHFAAHPDDLRAIRRGVIIKDVNETAVARTGAPDKAALLGSLDRLLPDTDMTFVQWLVAFARGDGLYRSETHITRPDGTAVDTLFTAGLPRDMREFEDILVSDFDITDYKASQARLAEANREIARASRVSTVGALSASIAHEVNSPLAAISANAQASVRWLSRSEPDLEEALASLRMVIESAARAKTVVERTRSFLSNAPVQTAPHDIAQLVSDSVRLVERDMRTMGIAVHIDVAAGLPQVLADAVNIQQVLVNLMMNAAQAMQGQPAPRDLTITARATDGKVRVDLRDCGPGMAPEVARRVFDPFFSTRPEGMGMGLAIARTCINAHGGRLWVTSAPGEGATFHFDLPTAVASRP